jgi:hypothetical protein
MVSTPFEKIAQRLSGRKIREALIKVLRTIETLSSSPGTVLRLFYAVYSPHTNAATFSSLRFPLSQPSVDSVVNLKLLPVPVGLLLASCFACGFR